jgi:hypothetical protein
MRAGDSLSAAQLRLHLRRGRDGLVAPGVEEEFAKPLAVNRSHRCTVELVHHAPRPLVGLGDAGMRIARPYLLRSCPAHRHTGWAPLASAPAVRSANCMPLTIRAMVGDLFARTAGLRLQGQRHQIPEARPGRELAATFVAEQRTTDGVGQKGQHLARPTARGRCRSR